MRHDKGFTLIELVVTIAIVGILTAIAVPAFTEQMRKSRRAEAIQALTDVQLRQERWRSNRANYLGTDSSAADIALFGAMPTSDYYTISITSAASATDYTISAAPISGGPQDGDKCGTFTLTNDNGEIDKDVSTGRTDCW